MRRRNTWTYWTYNAKCQDCGWAVSGRNGLGLAAQHYDRTGHTVYTNVEGLVKYLSEIENGKRLLKIGNLLDN